MAQIIGTSGADNLSGTADSDLLEGLGGNDSLSDTLGGGDQLDGNAGNDVLTVSRNGTMPASNVVINGGDGNDELRWSDDSLTHRATLDGGAGDDRIFVDGGRSVSVDGGDGDDVFMLTTGGVPPRATSGIGTITVRGNAGADTFMILPDTEIGAPYLLGLESIDRIDLSPFLTAKLIGWDGVTDPFAAGYLSVNLGSTRGRFAPASIMVDLDAGGDAFVSVDLVQFDPTPSNGANPDGGLATGHLITGYDPLSPGPAGVNQSGTAGADMLIGGAGRDTLSGGAGDDRLDGGMGADRLDGGDGRDTLIGGAGSDTLVGGAGDDSIADTGFRDAIYGEDGNDVITISGPVPGGIQLRTTIEGGNGDDRITISRPAPGTESFEISTGAGNDRVVIENASNGADLTTGDGDDVVLITGTGFFDSVVTGDGNDRVIALRPDGTSGFSLGMGRDYGTDYFTGYGRVYDLGNDQLSDVLTFLGRGDLAERGNGGPTTILNFRGGSDGDVLDLTDVADKLFVGWDGVTNPFKAGYMSLATTASGVILSVDPDAGGSLYPFPYQFNLGSVPQGSLTAANLGWAPDGSAAVAMTINGTSADEKLYGGAGDDTISGGLGNDTLQGGFGNDRLISTQLLFGEQGDNLVIGGPGSDTAVYQGLTRQYSSTLEAGFGTVTILNESNNLNDTLELVETITFGDGYRTTDVDSTAAVVFRFYDSVLDRLPDSFGFNGWVHAIENGATLKQVALAFATAPEFQAATGGLNNADFVEYLYVHSLGRASDAAGKAGWLQALNSGQVDRGDLVLAFSECSEHRSLTLDAVNESFFIYDESAATVASLYDTFADRLPDRGPLSAFTSWLQSGAMTVDQLATQFATSPEFRALTAGLDNRGIVEFMIRNALERDGTTAEVNGYVDQLSRGTSVGQVMLTISESVEHQILLQPNFNEGMVFIV